MADELGANAFVVSDLHLSIPGGELDNFRGARAFPKLLDEIIPAACRNEAATLVILGDFVDFVRIFPPRAEDENRPRRVGATEAESAAKFARAVSSNESVFRALERFAKDNRLVVLAGNHDVDMFWPAVRAAFADTLGSGKEHVTFVDRWMVEVSGVLLSHGHQFSHENRFYAVPRPFVYHAGQIHLERCWGTFFMEAVYNDIEYFAPYINKIHPEWKAAVFGLRNRDWSKIPPPLATRLLAFLMKYGWRVFIEAAMGTEPPPGPTSVADLQGYLAHSIPANLGGEVERVIAEDAEEATAVPRLGSGLGAIPGSMGVTAEDQFEQYAWDQLGRSALHTVVFGHTHRAFAPQTRSGIDGHLVNSGTWTGALRLEELVAHDHDALVVESRKPKTRFNYVHLRPLQREAELLAVDVNETEE